MNETAKQRDRVAIATQCAKIEKRGGDVLAYLKSQGYLYTTESIWQNMQREILHRTPSRITTGRPKEDEKMARRKDVSMIKLAEDTVRAVRTGINPLDYLEGIGYKSPRSAWSRIQRVYLEEHPGEKIPEYLSRRVRKIQTFSPNAPDKHTAECLKTASETALQDYAEDEAEAPTAPTEQQAEGIQGGYIDPKDAVKEMARKMAEKSGHVVTCCAPARESGVTVPDEVPEKWPKVLTWGTPVKQKVKVIEVETTVGSFRKEGDQISFRRADNGNDYNDRLCMTPDGWRLLQKEIDGVLEILEAMEE